VIRTFGGVFGSQSEKYDANGSESMSAKVSGAMSAPSVGAVFGPLEPSIGREARAPNIIPCLPWIGSQYGRVRHPLVVKRTGNVLGQPANVV